MRQSDLSRPYIRLVNKTKGCRLKGMSGHKLVRRINEQSMQYADTYEFNSGKCSETIDYLEIPFWRVQELGGEGSKCNQIKCCNSKILVEKVVLYKMKCRTFRSGKFSTQPPLIIREWLSNPSYNLILF